jgi:hypothetical protein
VNAQVPDFSDQVRRILREEAYVAGYVHGGRHAQLWGDTHNEETEVEYAERSYATWLEDGAFLPTRHPSPH